MNLTINLQHSEQVRTGLKAELELLDKMGVQLNWTNNTLEIPQPDAFQAVDIAVTSRSIYSDHQPFFALLLTKAEKRTTGL